MNPIIPKHNTAIALIYDGQGAPHVAATGKGAIADKIIETAKEHGIPLYQDPALAALLSKVQLGDSIPEALYVAVAKVIAFAYLVADKKPLNKQAQDSNK